MEFLVMILLDKQLKITDSIQISRQLVQISRQRLLLVLQCVGIHWQLFCYLLFCRWWLGVPQ